MSLWGITDTPLARPRFLDVGQVINVQVTAGGTGYVNGAAATFSAPPAGGITATGTINVTGGAITGVTITNRGAGYITAPTVTAPTGTATAPGGTGAAITARIAPIVYDHRSIVFVDINEAQAQSNKTKGITGAGWWLVSNHQDNSGSIRYNAECLISLARTQAQAGDAADDLIVPDVNTVITISVGPANQTTSLGGATFGVTAAFTAGTGTLTYQWQRRLASGARFSNVAAATGATLALTAQTAANTGDQYRVIVSGGGARDVISAPATLTFGT